MCTADILQKMSEINGNMIRLNVDRLKTIGEKDVDQLRILQTGSNQQTETNEISSKQPIQPNISDSIRIRLKDTFRMILTLLLTEESNAYVAGKTFLDSLKDTIIGFPAYQKEAMGEETRTLYEQTRKTLEDNKLGDLVNLLISCKEAIFKD